MPILSIITTAFNCLKTIRRCIEATISQVNEECEILVVDDGSTDGTADFLDFNYGGLECIRIIHQQNQGAAEAFNSAIEHARGLYILNVDDDDWLLPGAISLVLSKIDEFHPDIMQFGFRLYRASGKIDDYPTFLCEDFFATRKEAHSSPHFLSRFPGIGSTWSRKVIKKSILGGLKAEKPDRGADTVFIRKALVRAQTYLLLPQVLYVIYEDPNSISRSAPSSAYQQFDYERWERAIPFFQKEGPREEWPLIETDQVFYSYRDYCGQLLSANKRNRKMLPQLSRRIRRFKKMIMPSHVSAKTFILHRLWLYFPSLAFTLVNDLRRS